MNFITTSILADAMTGFIFRLLIGGVLIAIFKIKNPKFLFFPFWVGWVTVLWYVLSPQTTVSLSVAIGFVIVELFKTIDFFSEIGKTSNTKSTPRGSLRIKSKKKVYRVDASKVDWTIK